MSQPLTQAVVDPAAATAPPSLLFVDDEANILSALKRLFRPQGYRIHTAEGGAAALEILARESIDIVVSDMRMPEMNGAQLLEQVRARWPDTVRILLTGYAEVSATVDAINKGGIYRYIAKPWEENDLLLTVQHALEQKMLEREKQRLELLTRQQNGELQTLNASLEDKVRERTAELQKTMGMLEKTHERLKKSFIASIQVFSNFMELRDGAASGHSRRVADHARKVGLKMGLSEVEAQEIMVAGLLHDIGKLGLSDTLIRKPFSALNAEERAEVCKHPAKGQAVLMGLDQLKEAAKIIRSHHERFDGQGYPDGLSGLAIPLGARILSVVNDYDALQNGSLVNKKMAPEEARKTIIDGRGKRYDPNAVDAYMDVLGHVGELALQKPETILSTAQLMPGMALAHDLLTRDGILLLSKEYILDEHLIEQICNFERTEGIKLEVHVRTDRR